MDNWRYQKMLGVGLDVDWCKTAPGRTNFHKSLEEGTNPAQLTRDRGFDHVRIRVRDSDLHGNVNNKTGLLLIDEITAVVDACLSVNLTPIVAYQAAEFKHDPTSDEALESVVSWWSEVATRFAITGKSSQLAYNLLIETTGEVKRHNDRLNLLFRKTYEAIQSVDPGRVCIICPNNISNPEKLADLEIPEPSEHIVAEWHFYAAGASKTNKKKQWTSGTEYEQKLITDKIAIAKKWSEENGIPTWVGAWMANNYNDDSGALSGQQTLTDGAPAGGDYSVEEQALFANFMGSQLKFADVPYAVNSDTKFFDRETNEWYKSMNPVIDAILDPEKPNFSVPSEPDTSTSVGTPTSSEEPVVPPISEDASTKAVVGTPTFTEEPVIPPSEETPTDGTSADSSKDSSTTPIDKTSADSSKDTSRKTSDRYWRRSPYAGGYVSKT